MVQRFIVLSLALACGATVQAADQPAAAKADAAKGRQVAAQICAACHNPDGNSPVMGGMVAAITDQDMKNVAAFYASQTQKGGPSTARHSTSCCAGLR